MATKPKDSTPAGPVRQHYKLATGKPVNKAPNSGPKTPA